MKINKRLISFVLICTLLLSIFNFNVSAAAVNIYTIQYLDKVTNQSIVPPVIGTYNTSTPFTINGQVNFNGFQIDSVQVNGQGITHINGTVTVQNPVVGGINIIYFYNDTEAPKASIKPNAHFELNGDNNIIDILTNLHDNSGISNISMQYLGGPPDTSTVGIRNVEIELSDRSNNKTVLRGEVAVVGTARYTATFVDGASGKHIMERIIAPLSVDENKSLQFSFPSGYELTSVTIDDNEQQSGTVRITNAEDRNYNIVFTLRDIEPPIIRVIGPTSFQRGDSVDLNQLFLVTDNSDEPVSLTGNINTGSVGTFSVPITARDTTGNYTTINFNYTVYGTNTYTVQYINKLNNRELMPRSEPVQFNTRDDVVINLPVNHNGFTLTEVDLGANQSRAVIDLNTGRVTLTNLTDTSFVVRAIYNDTTKPIGTARTDVRVRIGATIEPMQLLASVFDNAGIEGLTASFSGTPPDTITAGVKHAVVLLRDAAGNVSDPINVTITVEGEDVTVRRTFTIRYINQATNTPTGNTSTLTTNIGRTIDAADLMIPQGYRIADSDWSRQLTQDDADNGIRVMVRVEQFTVRIRYIDNETDRVIRTDTMLRDRNTTISRGDLNVPTGYRLTSGNFTHNVTKDETLDIDVERREGEEPGEHLITIRYTDSENTNTVIDTQEIRADIGDFIESADLNIPAGYELQTLFNRHRVTGDRTLSVRVRKSLDSDVVINFIDGTMLVGSQTLNNYTESTVPVSIMILPAGYLLADITKTSYPKAAVIEVEVKLSEVSVYIVRQIRANEHANKTVPGKSNNFLVLMTYRNSDGSNTSPFTIVLEKVEDTINNSVYYIVEENSVPDTDTHSDMYTHHNPLGSSVKVEITNGIIYLATSESGTHRSYIVGYDIDGRREFRPDRAITRAEFSTLMHTNFIAPFTGGNHSISSFDDVSTDAWYFQAVESMRQLHIISGYVEEVNGQTVNIFKPNQPITKAEAATLLSRIRNVNPQRIHSNYNDIPNDAWFSQYVAQSASLGYFRYTEGKFSPQAPMTRGETIFAFNVAMGRKPFQATEYRNPFEDLNPTHPYFADIMEAVITHEFVMNGDRERRPGNE